MIFANTTEIERGSDEEAFYLRGEDHSVDHIIRCLSYKTCPVIKCSMGFGKRPLPYRLLYEHF
jgi:hypothetical protein